MAATAHSSRSWRPQRNEGFSATQKFLTLLLLASLACALIALAIYWTLGQSPSVTYYVHLHVSPGQAAGLPAPPTVERDLALLSYDKIPVSKDRYDSRVLSDDLAQRLADLPQLSPDQLRGELLGENDAGPDDTLVVYITGQGVAIEQQPYLATGTIQLEAGQTLADFATGEANIKKLVPLKQVLDAISASQAQTKLVLLDCGYMIQDARLGVDPNEFMSSLLSSLAVSAYDEKGLWIITSCSQAEKSHYDLRSGESFFAQSIHEVFNRAERGTPLSIYDVYASVCRYIMVRQPETAQLVGQTPLLMQGGRGLVASTDLDEQLPAAPAFYTFRPQKSKDKKPEEPDAQEREAEPAEAAMQLQRSATGSRLPLTRVGLWQTSPPPSPQETTDEPPVSDEPVAGEVPDDTSTELAQPATPVETPESLFGSPPPATLGELVARMVRLRDRLEDRQFMNTAWSPLDFAPHHWRWFEGDVREGNRLLIRWGADQALDTASQQKLPRYDRDQIQALRQTVAKLQGLGQTISRGQLGGDVLQGRHWVDEVLARWQELERRHQRDPSAWETSKTVQSRQWMQDIQDVHFRAAHYHRLFLAYSELTPNVPFNETLGNLYDAIARSRPALLDLSDGPDLVELQAIRNNVVAKETALVTEIGKQLVGTLSDSTARTYWLRQELLLVLMDSPLFREVPIDGRPCLLRSELWQVWQQWRNAEAPDLSGTTPDLPDPSGAGLQTGKSAQAAVSRRKTEHHRYYWRACRLDIGDGLGQLRRPSGHLQILSDFGSDPSTALLPGEERESLLKHWMLTSADYRDAKTLDQMLNRDYWAFLQRPLPLPAENPVFIVTPTDTGPWRTSLRGRTPTSRKFSLHTEGETFRQQPVTVALSRVPAELLTATLIIPPSSPDAKATRVPLGADAVQIGPLPVDVELTIEVNALQTRQQSAMASVQASLEFRPPAGLTGVFPKTLPLVFELPAIEDIAISAQRVNGNQPTQASFSEETLQTGLPGEHDRLAVATFPNQDNEYQFALETPSSDIRQVQVALYPVNLEAVARLLSDGPAQLAALHNGQLFGSGAANAQRLAEMYLERLDQQRPTLVAEMELTAGRPIVIPWLDPNAPPAPAAGEAAPATTVPAPAPAPVPFSQGLLCVIQDLDPQLDKPKLWYKWIESRLLSPDQFMTISRTSVPNAPDKYRMQLLNPVRVESGSLAATDIPLPLQVTAYRWERGRRYEMGVAEIASAIEPVELEIDPTLVTSDEVQPARLIEFAVGQWERAFVFDIDRPAASSSIRRQYATVRMEVVPHADPAKPDEPPPSPRFLGTSQNDIGFQQPGFDVVIRASVPPEDERTRNLLLKVRERDQVWLEARQTRRMALTLSQNAGRPQGLVIRSAVADYRESFDFNNQRRELMAELDIPGSAVQPEPHRMSVTIDGEPVEVTEFFLLTADDESSRTAKVKAGETVRVYLSINDRLSGLASDAAVKVFAVQGENRIALGLATVSPADPSVFRLSASTKNLQPTEIEPYSIEVQVEDRLGNSAEIVAYKDPTAPRNLPEERKLELWVEPPPPAPVPVPAAAKVHDVEVAVEVKDFRPFQNKDVSSVKVTLFAGEDDKQGKSMKALQPVDGNASQRMFTLDKVPEGPIRIEVMAEVKRFGKIVKFTGSRSLDIPKDLGDKKSPPLITADQLVDEE